ncbi:MAG: hypothetical protein ICV66_02580 [Chitinophagaceae bacterium]|nr:hypothetical protein [Chitinophagaceae bacterium]
MSTEVIAVLANLALTLSLIVAIIFGIAQIRAAKRDRRERLTLEALRNFQSREFAEIILFITTAKLPQNQQDWQSWPKEDRERFIQLMQQMESLGILLADRIIDIDLVDKTLGSFVTSTWEKCRPVVLEMREKNPDPFLAEYFQWMAEQIDKRMKENPRKPFFQSLKAVV